MRPRKHQMCRSVSPRMVNSLENTAAGARNRTPVTSVEADCAADLGTGTQQREEQKEV